MNSATTVTAAPPVPFRRFLPHEKPVAPAPRPRQFRDIEIVEEQDLQMLARSPFQLLSDEDVGVLLEARLQSAPLKKLSSYNAHALIYLPFAFALAAHGQTAGI